jgi:hypothetical protein
VADIQAVLAEYVDHLPLTVRQIFYRLIGAYAYPKTDFFSGQVLGAVHRARRAGIVPFDAIGMTAFR